MIKMQTRTPSTYGVPLIWLPWQPPDSHEILYTIFEFAAEPFHYVINWVL